MAHEFETGFFTKHEAWHKLGIVLAEAPDTEGAYINSGLTWMVNKVPMVAQIVAGGNIAHLTTDLFANVRDSDNRILGYGRKQYTVYQNKKAFEWCDPLVKSGYWTYEAAGSLKNGEVCWILLKQAEVQLIPNDTLKEYLLVNWSHNGQLCNVVMPTTIRVVCNNTLQLALKGKGGVKIRHMSNIERDMDKVKELYNLTREAFDAENAVWQKMIDRKMTDSQNEEFIDTFSPVEIGVGGRSETISDRINKFYKKMVFSDSSMNSETKGTLYGTYNAIQEGIEHYIGNGRVKDRGMNILFGQGREKVEKLNEMAMALIS